MYYDYCTVEIFGTGKRRSKIHLVRTVYLHIAQRKFNNNKLHNPSGVGGHIIWSCSRGVNERNFHRQRDFVFIIFCQTHTKSLAADDDVYFIFSNYFKRFNNNWTEIETTDDCNCETPFCKDDGDN